MDHFNGLTSEQLEALSILAEECGETVQRVGKILRHGFRVNPYTGIENSESLEMELADICVAMEILSMLGLIDLERIQDRMNAKLEHYGTEEGKRQLHHLNIPSM